MKYSVYYEILEARTIFNLVGPRDWRDNRPERMKREEKTLTKKLDFFNSLENDIIQNGITNPIIIVRNKIFEKEWPTLPGYAIKEKLVCPQIGGSRLYIAQKHNIKIPCIVCDYDGKYQKLKNISQYFSGKPKIKYFSHYIEMDFK